MRKLTEQHKEKLRLKMIGNKNACGIRKNRKINWDDPEELRAYNRLNSKKRKDYFREYSRRVRHEKGISKSYSSKYGGEFKDSMSKEYKKFHRKKYKYSLKKAGKLTIKIIQFVYEDNIKRFGTLTCYLCLNPIAFGKDHLEHKTPLSRGGTNERNNLEVACQSCNCKKHTKTELEYKMGVKKSCLHVKQLFGRKGKQHMELILS